MSKMLLHCGGLPATFEEVASVEVPTSTTTYRPVPHADIVRLIESEMEARFRIDKPERQFALNREGQQLFGTLKYNLVSYGDLDLSAFNKSGHHNLPFDALSKYGFTIAFRNAYDKSMSVGLAGGTNTFVCDNLAFSGNCFKIMRKHTQKVWEDLVPMVMSKIREVATDYIESVVLQESMKKHTITQDRGYEIIGLARGHGVLTPTQGNTALLDWDHTSRGWTDVTANGDKVEHPFAEHSNNAYGLYNTFTHALKLGHVCRKIDEYIGVSSMFEDLGLASRHAVSEAEIIH